MRPISMRQPRLLHLAAIALFALPTLAHSQAVAGAPGSGDTFKDTSLLKLPAGQRAAIYEFEDLECPACAHAYPIVHAAIDHYKIPIIRHDFPLQMHKWSRDAAITARYLQDKVSPEVAENFRKDVFANQTSISSKEDLQAFTRNWFSSHKQAGAMPFVMDPTGRFNLEVEQDYNLGVKIGLMQTPTIFVLAPKGWTQVTDVTQLYTTIDTALAQTPAKAASAKPTPARTTAHNNVRKSATAQN